MCILTKISCIIIYLIVNSSSEVADVKSAGYSEVSLGDFEETMARLVIKVLKSDPTVVELFATPNLILTRGLQDKVAGDKYSLVLTFSIILIRALYSNDKQFVTIDVSHPPLELHGLIAIPIKMFLVSNSVSLYCYTGCQ